MRIYLLLLFALMLFSCKNGSKNETDKNSNSLIASEKSGIDSTLIKKRQADSLANLMSLRSKLKIKSFEIIEYGKFPGYSKKTLITLDSVFVIEKPIKNDSLKGIVYQASDPYLLASVSAVIESKFAENIVFCEEQSYYSESRGSFVRLNVDFKNGLKTNLSFENCKSKSLKEVVDVLNRVLPKENTIKLPLKTIVDLTMSPDSLKTWKKLKSIAKYNDKTSFTLSEFDRSKLVRLDSTVFGKKIHETYALKSSYILAVKPNIGEFYPCVVYGQQFDCGQVTNFIAICMLDSLLQKRGTFDMIAGEWSDFEGDCQYSSELSDSIINKNSSYSFDVSAEELRRDDNIKSFDIKEKLVINRKGEILTIEKDTLNVKYFGKQ